MKKLTALCFLFLTSTALLIAQWTTVGSAAFSAGAAEVQSLTFIGTTPYVAYTDFANGQKVTVKKFNGSSWETVGSAGFSDGEAKYTALSSNGSTPYVIYYDVANSGATVKRFNGTDWETVSSMSFSDGVNFSTTFAFIGSTPYVLYEDGGATVKKFNGSNWETVGSAGFSAGSISFASLTFNGSTPYVAYSDASNGHKISVKILNGGNWETVGSEGFSAGLAVFNALAIIGSTPYVAYSDYMTGFKFTVQKFNGTNWEQVGGAEFSAGGQKTFSFVGSGSTPYVAFLDNENDGRASVKKFNGTNWEPVGTLGFSAGSAYFFSLAFNGTTPYVAYKDWLNGHKLTVMKLADYSLNVSAANGAVSKNPNLNGYMNGDAVQLTATPASGYVFNNWSGDASGSTNPLSVTMNANKNITANFIPTYTLTVNATNGTVTKDPNQSTVDSNTTVQLTATPALGYDFIGWSGSGSSGNTNPLTVTMNSNKNITANFSVHVVTYTLIASAVNGTITKSPNQSEYNTGTIVQLTATPASGYLFNGWGTAATGNTNPLSITMDEPKVVTADFSLSPWSTVGTAGFSAGTAGYTSLAFNGSTPYVVYQDAGNSNKATVKKFNGTGWESVGAEGFSAGNVLFNSLAFNDSTPYVSFYDGANGGKVSVMKFNGSSWEIVGSAGFSAGLVFNPSLAFTSSTPYVAYLDFANSSKATVMKFNGTSWEVVGAAGFSAGAASYSSLAFSGSTPYVAYKDGGNSDKTTVMKYDGANWVNVGLEGFSTGIATYTSLAFSGSTPFVAYADAGNSDKVTVMKFDGTDWIAVGTEGFSAGTATWTSLSFRDSIPYVAYVDGNSSSKATVMKFDGSDWVTVGVAGFSSGTATYTSLAFNGTTPYVAYRDGGNSDKETVMKLTGYSLDVSAAHGTVTKNPDYSEYQYGDVVQLTPNASTGYYFDSWSGGASGSSNPLSVTMSANKNITASMLLPSAEPGALDLSFGTGGKVQGAVTSKSAFVRNVAIQSSDGKIIVVGSTNTGTVGTPNSDFLVVRYNKNGTLDQTFGTGGKVTTDIGSGTDDQARSVAVQSDGRILVAGRSENGGNTDFAVVRYTVNGTLDIGFDGDGKVTTDIGTSQDYCESVVIQSTGKIVAAGGTSSQIAVVRYNTDGSLDDTFDGDDLSGNGIITTSFGTNPFAFSSAVQSNDKIVLAGYTTISGSSHTIVVRYNSDGILDTGFDGDGKVSTVIGTSTSSDAAYDVAVGSDGKIVVCGYSENGFQEDFAVVRYLSDGSLDTGFDGDGKLTTFVLAGNSAGRSVAIQSSGKIVVAGTSTQGDNNSAYLFRYNVDGTPDAGFNFDGLAYVTTAVGNDLAYGVALQSNGDIVVAGYYKATVNGIFLMRFGGGASAPLPVELVSFTAALTNTMVELKWNTATEINNYGFAIERRVTGNSLLAWTKIGFIEGAGTSNAPRSYSYVDNAPNGTVAYRLKQIDRDGKFNYSGDVEVTVNNTPLVFGLSQNYPNPFNPSTTIAYQLPAAGHVMLKVYDMIGREVASLVNEVKNAGSYVVQFDASTYASGIYFSKLQSGDKMQIKKMMLLK
ncbi:MAG: InlB B-repeat-containing protein [Bacteroidota bacterium]